MPSDAELAKEILADEALLRFPSFTSENAVLIGMSLRKRFRASKKYGKGRGAVISVQTIMGTTLFACSIGDGSDISLDSWERLEGMVKVVKRTGHSTLYIEKGMSAVAKTGEQLGLPFPEYRIEGGAFPLWLENAPSIPIGVIALYSGSPIEDHNIVVRTLRRYFSKVKNSSLKSNLSGDSSGSAAEGKESVEGTGTAL